MTGLYDCGCWMYKWIIVVRSSKFHLNWVDIRCCFLSISIISLNLSLSIPFYSVSTRAEHYKRTKHAEYKFKTRKHKGRTKKKRSTVATVDEELLYLSQLWRCTGHQSEPWCGTSSRWRWETPYLTDVHMSHWRSSSINRSLTQCYYRISLYRLRVITNSRYACEESTFAYPFPDQHEGTRCACCTVAPPPPLLLLVFYVINILDLFV